MFSSHRNHHRCHLLVSLYHCLRTAQSSHPHSSRSLRSLHSFLSHHRRRSRPSPSFRLLNRRPYLFLCPKRLLFHRASFMGLLLRLIYRLPLQLIRNVLLLLIKLLLRWRFLRILHFRLARHRFLSVLRVNLRLCLLVLVKRLRTLTLTNSNILSLNSRGFCKRFQDYLIDSLRPSYEVFCLQDTQINDPEVFRVFS